MPLMLLLLVFGLSSALQPRSQEPKKPEEKAKVDQHWRIVPDIAPVDLQRQLKLLNDDGVVVNQSEIVLVGDKFTIMVCDPAEGDGEEQ